MIPLKDKRGLNRRGHILFSLGLAIISIFILKVYIIKEMIISVSFLIFHVPFFLIGSLLPDWIEKGGKSLISHRKFFHSGRMLWILLIVLLPVTLWLAIRIPIKTIFIFTYNNYTLAAAICFGILSHLMGDALTSKLKR